MPSKPVKHALWGFFIAYLLSPVLFTAFIEGKLALDKRRRI